MRTKKWQNNEEGGKVICWKIKKKKNHSSAWGLGLLYRPTMQQLDSWFLSTANNWPLSDRAEPGASACGLGLGPTSP